MKSFHAAHVLACVGSLTAPDLSLCLLRKQGLGGDYYSSSAGQRDRMLTATQRMEQSSDMLNKGRNMLAETEVGWGFREHPCHA